MSKHLCLEERDRDGNRKTVNIMNTSHTRGREQRSSVYNIQFNGPKASTGTRPIIEQEKPEKELLLKIYPLDNPDDDEDPMDLCIPITNPNIGWSCWVEIEGYNNRKAFFQDITRNVMTNTMWTEFGHRPCFKLGFSDAHSKAYFMRRWKHYLHPSSAEFYFKDLEVFQLKVCITREKNANGDMEDALYYNAKINDAAVYKFIAQWSKEITEITTKNIECLMDGVECYPEKWEFCDDDEAVFNARNTYRGTVGEFDAYKKFFMQTDTVYNKEKLRHQRKFCFEELNRNQQGAFKNIEERLIRMEKATIGGHMMQGLDQSLSNRFGASFPNKKSNNPKQLDKIPETSKDCIDESKEKSKSDTPVEHVGMEPDVQLPNFTDYLENSKNVAAQNAIIKNTGQDINNINPESSKNLAPTDAEKNQESFEGSREYLRRSIDKEIGQSDRIQISEADMIQGVKDLSLLNEVSNDYKMMDSETLRVVYYAKCSKVHDLIENSKKTEGEALKKIKEEIARTKSEKHVIASYLTIDSVTELENFTTRVGNYNEFEQSTSISSSTMCEKKKKHKIQKLTSAQIRADKEKSLSFKNPPRLDRSHVKKNKSGSSASASKPFDMDTSKPKNSSTSNKRPRPETSDSDGVKQPSERIRTTSVQDHDQKVEHNPELYVNMMKVAEEANAETVKSVGK